MPDKKKGISLTRRDFLKIGGLALTSLALKPYVDVLNGLYRNGPEDGFENDIENAVNFLKNEYGVSVFTGMPKVTNFFQSASGDITGTDLTRYELSRGLELVLEEIIKYPKNYFRENLVWNIRFINDVKIGNLNYDGGFGATNGTLGIAYSAEGKEKFREYYRGVFHHELYHGTDYQDNFYTADDKEWEKIHNCGCNVYWNIGGRDSKRDIAPPQSPLEWFLNPEIPGFQGPEIAEYAQISALEDRAVTAQTLMIPNLHKNAIDRIATIQNKKTKGILEEKIRLIKKDFFDWSDGQMNNKYWKDLLDGKVIFGYFS